MNVTLKAITSFAILAAALAVNGCAATVISEGSKAAWEDRLAEDQIVDTKIKIAFNKRLIERDKDLVWDVSADVWEQRFMLTGTLDSAAERFAVVALARKDKRIKVLYDEIQIVSSKEKEQRREQAKKKEAEEKSGIGQSVNDFWIETKIKAKLLTASGITSVNYRWRSVRNKVYIIGHAPDGLKLKRILQLIKWTDGVKSTKHFIQIKPKATGS